MGNDLPSAWHFHLDLRQPCRVMEVVRLWNGEVAQVWLPQSDSVMRVPVSRLRPLQAEDVCHPAHIRSILYASKLQHLLSERVLLAPASSRVVPLPHQLRALRRATSGDRVRFLLADEVGLGKTIEAGLILRELKLRGLVRRILIVAPKGLITQWIAEMRTHFDEEFRHFSPGDFGAIRHMMPAENVWQSFHQVICSVDGVKPMAERIGWTSERLQAYNRERFDDLVTAGWDLVIVDEAHRLGGSTEQVARYQLGRGLAQASPYLLLLSATPHQGKTDAFQRLLSLLDDRAFPDIGSITKERIAPYVIRTEKRQAVTAEGKALFLPRLTKLVPIGWDGHEDQQQLYEAVTSYIRDGYNQAMREQKSYIGFLMVLMQRLVTSSTRAIRTTLERRLEVLSSNSENPEPRTQIPELTDEWSELDGQEQLEILLQRRQSALRNEREEVKRLLLAAQAVEARGPDTKATALADWIYKLQSEESEPEVKVLVFTEFVPTQEMLYDFLSARGISVVCLNGSLSLDERKNVQQAFAKNVRVLVSTDAGGEGLNLQFCHLIVNFDIPWSPMRLEQRIGRVDRIGQKKPVRALNFVLEDSVEFRVREVLEEKLAVIFEEFGIDKTSDVLDSGEAGAIFDQLFVEAILDPDCLHERVVHTTEVFRRRAHEERSQSAILADENPLETKEAKDAANLPIKSWIREMVLNDAEWRAVCVRNKAGPSRQNFLDLEQELTLENAEVQRLLSSEVRWQSGFPIPRVAFYPALPGGEGVWSLWKIGLSSTGWSRNRILPLFLDRNGKVMVPTARYYWDQLASIRWKIFESENSEGSFFEPDYLRSIASSQSESLFLELQAAHSVWLRMEREKADHSFKSRMRLIMAVGLPHVREYRRRKLLEEQAALKESLDREAEPLPTLDPILVMEVVSA